LQGPEFRQRVHGQYLVFFNFRLDKPAPQDGYIVQQVKWKDTINGKSNGETFWEAWLVKKDQTEVTAVQNKISKATDSSSHASIPDSEGIYEVTGTIKFFYKSTTGNLGDTGQSPVVTPDENSGFGFANQAGKSGRVFSTVKEPTWWKEMSANGEKTGSRTVIRKWDNCTLNELDITPAPK
jgi:hypothetical protein